MSRSERLAIGFISNVALWTPNLHIKKMAHMSHVCWSSSFSLRHFRILNIFSNSRSLKAELQRRVSLVASILIPNSLPLYV